MVDVVYRAGDGRPAYDVSLTLRAGARAGDVARALTGADEVAGLVVDGRWFDPATELGDVPLCAGSTVETSAGAAAAPATGGPMLSPAVELRVVGGLAAGHRFELPPGNYLIGRAGGDGVDVPLHSATVSLRHAALAVGTAGECRLRDLGSCNGLRVEGSFVTADVELARGALVELGAVQLVVGAVPADDRPLLRRPGRAGLIAFDRMPRTLSSTAAHPLRVPAALPDADHSPRLSVAAVLAPLGIAAVLYVVMPRTAMMLVFLVLSPFLSVATWAEERRRARKQRARRERGHQQALAAFAADLRAACGAELLRLRAAAPDVSEVVRRARAPSARLWERRPAHHDFGSVRVGTADLPWQPCLENRGAADAAAGALLAAAATVPLAPLDVRLVAGRCLGVVGGRGESLRLVRSLVLQLAVHHGPADVAIAVLTQPDRVPDWDWTKWLPHVRTAAGDRLLAGTAADRQSLAARLLHPESAEVDDAAPLHVVVMDADGITAGRNCAPRELLHGSGVPLAAIVLADRLDQLPGACTDIIEITHPDGVARYSEPGAGRVVRDVLLAGVGASIATTAAVALARFEDADLVEAGAELPPAVPLPALLPAGALTAEGLERSWSGRRTGRLSVPIGVAAGGPVTIDLVADGPHGLIAGTTGAGKSELLRTIVASLAAAYSPLEVTFLLIDFKGGSAFADCARLPHTVGLVTDLDEHLGSRALTCLEAELRHRERMLRDSGATDLRDYLAAGETGGPLPRLVVAVDEFATLAAELPDFIDALVGVAQRGRSLGVHLVLATQRPRGAVNDNIRANTNLRIALRVHDAADSSDVLDARDAAGISRLHPGRALLRLGPGELVAFQSAFISGTALTPRPPGALVRVRPAVFGPADADVDEAIGAGDESPTDLARLVDAAVAVAARLRLPPARRPWPDPLPARLLIDQLPDVSPAAGWCAPIGLADEPANQRQVAYCWESAAGGLLLYGVAGSGTSTALAAIALSLARRYSPSDLHLYALDFGTQLLAPLADLPHTGAVLGPAERDRHERLIRRLRAELSRRQELLRSVGAAGVDEHSATCSAADRLPAVVLLLDNWSAFSAAFDDLAGFALRDDLVRIIADGPGLGVFTVLAADRAAAIPSATAGLVTQRLVFQLSDRHDYGAFGIPAREIPAFVPGRAIDAATRREVQVALPHPAGIAAAVDEIAAQVSVHPSRLPSPVLSLPADLLVAELAPVASIDDSEWWLPFALGDRELQPVGFRLREGDHALVAGSPRSGKSSLLQLIGAIAQQAAPAPALRLIVVAPQRSPLQSLDCATVFGAADEAAAAAFACSLASPCLVLVDDAERVDDASGALRRLLSLRRPGDRIIAAGRADALRASYGHWTQELRRSRQGVVLKPNPDADGDLWGMLLPRARSVQFAPGRGYLVLDGEAELVQVARS